MRETEIETEIETETQRHRNERKRDVRCPKCTKSAPVVNSVHNST